MVSRGSKIIVGLVVVLGAAVVAFQALSGGDLFRTATNSVSRSLCGAAFISQVDPDRLFREEQLPNMRSIGWALRYHVDHAQHEVRTTVMGAFAARAVYRPGLGCLLVHGGEAVPDAAGLGSAGDATASGPVDPMGPTVVEPTDPALRQALDAAFAEPDPKNPRLTKGIVVLHDGKLIGERYAPGYGPQTPIWGHSLSKSVTNALVGILVRQGKLKVDPRVDQLLRMESGLPFDETGGPPNPMSRMFFLESDMARFAAQQPLAHPPGSTWAYSNLGYVLLSRMAMDAAGARDAVAAERFVRNELFAPLGMHHAVIETDVAGTPVGSSHVYASTRDFARFGQLYLDDGMVNGQRILPEDWVAYSHSQTLDTGYGAGFWTNLVDKGDVPVWDTPWGWPGLPKDMYFARGAFGQYIVIVPSEHLVVARLGISINGGTGIAEVVAKIIVALHASQAAGAAPHVAMPQATVEATTPQVWREAFQSSPARYDPLAPEFVKLLVDKFKMPPAMVEQMRPQTASGTQRIRVAVSAGGPQIRIRISNEEGTAPMALAAASVGLAGDGYVARAGTLKPLTFGGRRSVTIAMGAPMVSDPIALPVTSGTELVVSTYAFGSAKLNPLGSAAIMVAAGEQTLKNELNGGTPMHGRPAVTGVSVLSTGSQHVIATLGDSITDANRMAPTEFPGWPEALGHRLAARQGGGQYAVVNAGIGGNRILGSGWGPSALARLDRDVLRIDGLSHLIVLEGTNDIGMSGHSAFGNSPVVTPEDMIAGFRQIIARAHARGVLVVIGTIMPFGESVTHYSTDKERMRQAVNQWIRTSHEADGVIDFDQIARDPAKPVNMRKEFGSEDGLHPGAAGYMAMGEAIDLSLFK